MSSPLPLKALSLGRAAKDKNDRPSRKKGQSSMRKNLKWIQIGVATGILVIVIIVVVVLVVVKNGVIFGKDAS